MLYARQVDQRSAVFQKAVEVGDAYVLKTKVHTIIDLTMIVLICTQCVGIINESSTSTQEHCNISKPIS